MLGVGHHANLPIQRVGILALAVLAGVTSQAAAQDLLNATCTPGNKLLVTDYKNHPTNTVGRGHDMAAFVRGKNAAGIDKNHMMLVWSMDSGKGDGGISFWSWDQPTTWSAPTLKRHFPAAQLREAHSTPVTNMFANDWRTWVLQATTGFSVYDLDSIAKPRLVTTYGITGQSTGGVASLATCASSGACAGSFNAGTYDYDNGAVWFTALAAPYIYVAQAANGLNIYRFTDPANAASIAWVRRYDTSWFGHRVNQFWVRGNLGFALAVGGDYGVTVVDLSDPANLVKLKQYGITSSPPVRKTYAWTLNGSRLYAATQLQGDAPAGLAFYDIDPFTSALTQKKETSGQCSSGGYAAIQDNYAHVGLSICYQKVKIPELIKVAPTAPPYWSVGIQGADNDFATPFGNVVFAGNDHHTRPGSAVLCHQAARDVTAPAVNGRNPRAGATGVKISTGVGLSFTDNLKPWTITTSTLPVRVKATGAIVPGYYSYQLNTVNFRPSTPFARATTYEVAVTSGVKDLVNNGAVASTATFTTQN